MERRQRQRNLSIGRDRFMIGHWQADPEIAYLSSRRPADQIKPENLRACLDKLRQMGFKAVMTPALHPDEAIVFLTNGFQQVDSLAVLGHSLRTLSPPLRTPGSKLHLRRGRRSDLPVIFDLDNRAFPPNWRLDEMSLREARTATTHSRFRVAELRDNGSEPMTVGYAIAGRTGSMGFLQRLATDPNWSGRGVGSTLTNDALEWARSNRCTSLLVNTQKTNRRALALYESLGFERTKTQLTVLRCSL
ncbi:MAG: GNAT family N-acetyltransferase [Microthrixaceae bacterium]|nr:GNAT family N-acetyltransferase [Microthrixaceae bacterium]